MIGFFNGELAPGMKTVRRPSRNGRAPSMAALPE
jgi:hypothetical protein